MIKAFWLEEEDDDGEDVSSYTWECPHCGHLNSIGDDFIWNGKKGTHCTKTTYFCENDDCPSEEEHYICRD